MDYSCDNKDYFQEVFRILEVSKLCAKLNTLLLHKMYEKVR